jgi:hypothetical protein
MISYKTRRYPTPCTALQSQLGAGAMHAVEIVQNEAILVNIVEDVLRLEMVMDVVEGVEMLDSTLYCADARIAIELVTCGHGLRKVPIISIKDEASHQIWCIDSHTAISAQV